MGKKEAFQAECADRVKSNEKNQELTKSAREFMEASIPSQYSYNFSWMGRPVIQYPQDIVAMQELIWEVQPDLIIETGIAHGGSLIMYASFMEMMGITDGQVIGIDIDIRQHNRIEIENHPVFHRVTLLEGSSTDESIVRQVEKLAQGKKRVMVCLDSMHSHDHVLKELSLYSHLVTKGSYLVVFDTIIEDLPDEFYSDRPWSQKDNPKTAVFEYLKQNDRFEIDTAVQNKLLITVAPSGYLKCVKE